jgi:hypothetical protein
MKDDPAYQLILRTLVALAREEVLDIECDCADCLAALAEETYELLSPYQMVDAA